MSQKEKYDQRENDRIHIVFMGDQVAADHKIMAEIAREKQPEKVEGRENRG